MAEVLLFHHAQGLTPGCRSLAEALRAGGHVVHLPDLYEGRTFDDLDAGVAHAREIGFDTIVERGRAAAAGLPDGLVYAGMSLGALPAATLALERPGARGLLFLHGCVRPSDLGGVWPDGLPAQIHVMEDDAWGDLEEARVLSTTVEGVELFLYPGDAHLFTDDSLPVYDADAAALVRERVLRFLGSELVEPRG
jgi:dienelactone hydrolase